MRAEQVKHIAIAGATNFYKQVPEPTRKFIRKNSNFERPFNPNRQTVIDGMINLIRENCDGVPIANNEWWLYSPWADKPIGVADYVPLAIAFADHHNISFKPSVIPPEKIINRIINEILRLKNVDLLEQFTISLRHCDDQPAAAALSLILATRLMSRGWDKRLYPNITVNEDTMLRWAQTICWFDTPVNDRVADGTGNTYYFWILCTASMLCNALGFNDKKEALRINTLFKRGYPMMDLSRKISGQPLVSNHKEVSHDGYITGFDVSANFLGLSFNPK